MRCWRPLLLAGALLGAGLPACAAESQPNILQTVEAKEKLIAAHPRADTLRSAYLGGGCFWCVEAVYRRVDGVIEVISGYAGGKAPEPTYEQVVSGTTGHAEVVRVVYDPERVDYSALLDLFWRAHDPTTPNRQGNDVGPQYRSIILHQTSEERELAITSRDRLNRSGLYPNPTVTEIVPLDRFYPAEDYHQTYYERNPRVPYNQFIIRPKIEKLGLERGTRGVVE
jgi:peptide-methionine (S)-S-oxide reductase